MRLRSSSLVLAALLAAPLLVSLAFTSTAWADPAAQGPVTVGGLGGAPMVDPLAALRVRIEQARATQPEAFAAVAAVQAAIPTLDARRRGPFAAASRPLRSLGDGALLPMLGALLDLTAPAAGLPAGWSPRQGTTWAVALIEAIGSARDPQALPALAPLLRDATQPVQVLSAAAQAIGRIGTDEAAALLVERLSALTASDLTRPDARRDALLTGAGSCRRAAAAEAFLLLARSWPPDADPNSTRALTRALHALANAQAWKTPIVAASGESTRVHDATTLALTTLWLTFPDPSTRAHLATAFTIIGAPTP